MTIHQVDQKRQAVYDAFGKQLLNVKACNPESGQVWFYTLDEQGNKIGVVEEQHKAPLEIGIAPTV